ncbi:hypothetical protein [Pedobacter sp.]|uniref:hypothetical protein n=1 Tax=Pedobacter sp. TaxID=1411316 RepID=UPI003C7669A1
MIRSHNQLSEKTNPGEEDIKLTARLVETLTFLITLFFATIIIAALRISNRRVYFSAAYGKPQYPGVTNNNIF